MPSWASPFPGQPGSRPHQHRPVRLCTPVCMALDALRAVCLALLLRLTQPCGWMRTFSSLPLRHVPGHGDTPSGKKQPSSHGWTPRPLEVGLPCGALLSSSLTACEVGVCLYLRLGTDVVCPTAYGS